MAVTIDAATLAGILHSDETVAGRVLGVASALVTRYAPDAPDEIANEAVIRCAGWLYQQPAAAVRSETAGPLSVDYQPSSMSALRHSGGMALLSPWKVRRAGAIGE